MLGAMTLQEPHCRHAEAGFPPRDPGITVLGSPSFPYTFKALCWSNIRNRNFLGTIRLTVRPVQGIVGSQQHGYRVAQHLRSSALRGRKSDIVFRLSSICSCWTYRQYGDKPFKGCAVTIAHEATTRRSGHRLKPSARWGPVWQEPPFTGSMITGFPCFRVLITLS